MTSRRFLTLDVFTNRRFSGNPLAVVLDAEGLDGEAMQAIAREFNLSETVFLLPPRDPINLACARIFTPAQELSFAGHPTIGAAIVLGLENGARPRNDLNFFLEEEVGVVPCTVHLFTRDHARALFELPRLPVAAGEAASAEIIAAALGLETGEIGFDAHRPSRFAIGPAFTFVPLRDANVLGRASIQPQHWATAFGGKGEGAAYLYTRGGVAPDAAFRARMLEQGFGMGEDPATGSAVAAIAGVVMAFEPPADGQHALVVEQGHEMGRPSRIVLGLDVWERRLDSASIGGEAVLVSEGRINA
ncbi:PhzF family phenazine biosynthesis protein [Terrihabitans sp. B22-R8]|uniref:PhzF family phenazine biosynthesis protein n=1 Tax=Terrihabitans sp. B22-R8 TaxID=3425128 RepID=UPI00403D1E0C